MFVLDHFSEAAEFVCDHFKMEMQLLHTQHHNAEVLPELEEMIPSLVKEIPQSPQEEKRMGKQNTVRRDFQHFQHQQKWQKRGPGHKEKGGKPFSCTVCGRAFTKKLDVERNMGPRITIKKLGRAFPPPPGRYYLFMGAVA